MRFFNHSSRDIWLGIYSTGDRAFAATLMPWGARISVPANGQWQYNVSLAPRVQVATWDSGTFGSIVAQPRTMLSSGNVSFAEDDDGKYLYQGAGLPSKADKVQHLFVLMLENRSFDHVLGWLYESSGNVPPRNIPFRSPPRYEGLVAGTFWNTAVAANHANPNGRVYATKVAPGVFTKPDPNPPEICPRFVEGIFGTEEPGANMAPTMTGFVQAYAKREGGNTDPTGIMQSYTPEHLPRLSQLARDFAVCDGWFGSLPCMTWPNRSFLHAGTSFGRLNNSDGKYSEGNPPDVVPNFSVFAGRRTVFDELDVAGVPYGLYSESEALITLLGAQFFDSGQKARRPFRHTRDMAADLAKTDVHQAPWYVFIEPEYLIGANDQHPPEDVRKGDDLIGKMYQIVSGSPLWKRSALLIVYDEHGGCYDHVPPPGAVPPDNSVGQFAVGSLNPFTTYGPRVPAVLVSPQLSPGTVFRGRAAPYDHTSVLGTLRDMLYPFGGATPFFANNPRIALAPTLGDVFNDKGASECTSVAIDLLLLSE